MYSYLQFTYYLWFSLQCRRFLRARECFCSRSPHFETSQREKMGWVKGSGEGAGRENRKPPPPLPLSFCCPRTYLKGYEHEQGFAHPKYACNCRLSMIGLTLQATIRTTHTREYAKQNFWLTVKHFIGTIFFFLWRDTKFLKDKWITQTIHSKLKLYC